MRFGTTWHKLSRNVTAGASAPGDLGELILEKAIIFVGTKPRKVTTRARFKTEMEETDSGSEVSDNICFGKTDDEIMNEDNANLKMGEEETDDEVEEEDHTGLAGRGHCWQRDGEGQ